ncbi:flavin reductase ActVB [Actinopolyspora xinjiangensis]|uniref:Flavin reductase ActVB n=1 Tax=Actinopolyspora xinjiangensis TaxID=405564 RepID=A0A1H0WXG0_9ACTN|nr:flavin reductase family protein [Actinopolyspora xinjiangensis]SDP95279.1 flavin reductase ActVB [Actinopolyspora xinjiangensis]
MQRLQSETDLVPIFKEAMASLAASVTLATSLDEDGEPVGFAASTVISVSMDPPLLLVCQDKSARTHPIFSTCSEFAINLLNEEQRDLAVHFSTPGAKRFAETGFIAGRGGVPVHPDALARVHCGRERTIDAGDHTILLGRVREVDTCDGRPLIYQERGFHRIERVPKVTSDRTKSLRRQPGESVVG